MARWRTHNRRADKKRRMPYARFKRLRKAARYGLMYGMGIQKLFGSIAQFGLSAKEAAMKIEDFRGGLMRYAVQNRTIPAVLPQGEAVVPASLRPIYRDWDEIEARVLAHYRGEE